MCPLRRVRENENMGFEAKLDQSNNGVAADLRIIDPAVSITLRTKPLRAVLLDIDGTLVESNEAHAAAWADACAAFGYDRSIAFFRPLIGMGGDQVLPKISADLDSDRDPGKALASRRSEIFKETYLSTLRPTNGARDLVSRLHDAGYRCVIASSANADELESLLAIVKIAELIDFETTSDDASASKPAPDIVEAALKKAGVEADAALLVGDTPHDIAAAARAGVPTIAFRCGGWSDEGLSGAVAIYDDPADLIKQYDTSLLYLTANR